MVVVNQKNKAIFKVTSTLLVLLFNFLIVTQVQAVEFLRATINENPYNKTAQQLRDKEKQLSEREQALNALQKKMEGSLNTVMAISGGLFLLILINFALDVRRKKNTLALVNK